MCGRFTITVPASEIAERRCAAGLRRGEADRAAQADV